MHESDTQSAAATPDGTSIANSRSERYPPSANSLGSLEASRRRTLRRFNRLPPWKRLMAAACGITLLGLLAVARGLSPDPEGFGTHTQLGLPPCTFVKLFDQPCPSCGMTTAWAHAVRGEIGQAAGANVGGTLLAATAMVVCPWLLASSMAGRWLLVRLSERGLVIYVMAVMAVVMMDWWMR